MRRPLISVGSGKRRETPDKIDYHSLARVTYGVYRALARMVVSDPGTLARSEESRASSNPKNLHSGWNI